MTPADLTVCVEHDDRRVVADAELPGECGVAGNDRQGERVVVEGEVAPGTLAGDADEPRPRRHRGRQSGDQAIIGFDYLTLGWIPLAGVE